LSTRSYKAGKDEKGYDVWGTAAQLVIQAYGELNMRLRAGQLIHASNPIVIYEGDTFIPRTNENGDLIVEYKPLIPRKKGAKIIGCYVQLKLKGGINDYKWLLEDDIERLRDYSNRNNSSFEEKKNKVTGKENDLYGKNGEDIDPGFLAAKTLKHAMKTLQKLRLSDGVVLDDEDPINTTATFNAETKAEEPGVVIQAGETSNTDENLF